MTDLFYLIYARPMADLFPTTHIPHSVGQALASSSRRRSLHLWKILISRRATSSRAGPVIDDSHYASRLENPEQSPRRKRWQFARQSPGYIDFEVDSAEARRTYVPLSRCCSKLSQHGRQANHLASFLERLSSVTRSALEWNRSVRGRTPLDASINRARYTESGRHPRERYFCSHFFLSPGLPLTRTN